MAIEFHCEHCGRLVRAADEHAGKRGKCPTCHQSVYVPTPSEALEPLRLAPIDEQAERERQRLAHDAAQLAQALRGERESPPEGSHGPEPIAVGGLPAHGDIESAIIEYVLAMASGRLTDADALAIEVQGRMNQAEPIIDRLSLDEIPPPKLAKVPRPVLRGFLKQLRKG